MARINYEKINKGNYILRDHLAADRTLLANERTFLAYVRTALTFAIAGITIIKFFQGLTYQVIGWIAVCLGSAILLFGIGRCAYTTKNLNRFIKK